MRLINFKSETER